MKFSTFVVILLSVLGGTTSAYAELSSAQAPTTFPFVAKVQASTLNVRTGTSTSHRVITALKKGDTVVVYEKRNGWAKIPFPKHLWVYKKYIQIEGNWGTITSNRVNIRDLKTDNVRSRVILQAMKGDRFEVVSHTGDWVEIIAPEGAYAWVSSKYISYVMPYQVWVAQKHDAEVYKRLMSQAQALQEEQAKLPQEKASYDEVILLYSQAKKLTTDPLQKEIIDLKIAQAKKDQELSQKLLAIENEKKELAQRLKKMKDDYTKEVAAKAAEIENLKKPKLPTYVSVGWVAPVGRYYNRPAAFRLTKGAQVLYYLDSTAYDLNLYISKWVGVKGKIITLKNTPIKLIQVTGIDILRIGDTGFKIEDQ